MSRDVCWKLSGADASLACGPLHAALVPLSPADGLSRVSLEGASLDDCCFLGVDISGGAPPPLTECYQRGGDFIARYAQTGERPFAVMAYWRAGLLEIEGTTYPRVDLVVSVETSLLDSRPLLAAKSRGKLALTDDVFRGPGFLLARFRETGYSYAEMCHPDDAIAAAVEKSRDISEWTTWLFGQPLEKGVILRSRLRGIFVPSEKDENLATLALAEFAASAPPLTT